LSEPTAPFAEPPRSLSSLRSGRVLVVDDDRAVRAALSVNLNKAGFSVAVAENGEEALALVGEEEPDLVLSDVRMPGLGGTALLERLRAGWPDLPVILMTGQGSVPAAVEAMRAGATDYLIKPVRKDELLLVIDRALQDRALRREVAELRVQLEGYRGFEHMIGESPAMSNVFRLVEAVAPLDALVLVTGPTGTGKELVSQAIHTRSRRKSGPLVAVNCGALPEGLLESELFGHEKGAFTGAVRQHRGKFEQADRGTLVMDEVGEMPLATQVKLLRVLQSGELQRVGGSETVRVDVRVVAATNRDLLEEVRKGHFREDLYYRLNVFHIPVPALSERREDIPALAQHFLEKYVARHRKRLLSIHPHALQQLLRAPWPGNIRQLEHTIERAVVLTPGPEILTFDLDQAPTTPSTVPSVPPTLVDLPPTDGGLDGALAQVERRLILQALESFGGVQAKAAKSLGISRSNLHYRMQRLGIHPEPRKFN
jgi:two-component system response regulator AtoC